MAEPFTDLSVRNWSKPGLHPDGDRPGGLYLRVTPSKPRAADGDSTAVAASGKAKKPAVAFNKAWVFIYKAGTKRSEMGLGSYPTVSLKAARDAADAARRLRAAGLDPLIERRRAKEEAAEAARAAAEPVVVKVDTFADWADRWFDKMRASYTNAKHRAQVEVTLGIKPYDIARVRGDLAVHREHVEALQALRQTPIADVDADIVEAVLRPIWLAKPETANRLRERIEAVMALAIAKKAYTGPNPALLGRKNRGDGLIEVLPTRPKRTAGAHHASLPYRHVPALMWELSTSDDASSLLLQFIILTAARTGEARGARWGEVDLHEAIWTVPASRMKAKRPHVVPLSDAALAILARADRLRRRPGPDEFIFPGAKWEKPLTDMAAAMALRRAARVGDDGIVPPWAVVTVHGFRSSFRRWAAERTDVPHEVAEVALAHKIFTKTEEAYLQTDFEAKRRALMDQWAIHCSGGIQDDGKVISLNAARRAR